MVVHEAVTTDELLDGILQRIAVPRDLYRLTLEWRLDKETNEETCAVEWHQHHESGFPIAGNLTLVSKPSRELFQWLQEKYEMPMLAQQLTLSLDAEKRVVDCYAHSYLIKKRVKETV